jgi:prepilin-type N-terminal cleavage/methylation domain-containing protein/prepilin-type processing-associated H-X9-DG protein
MSCRQALRRGFTLIELLVVIAIIAILAAILFPVFAQARDAARQSACLSNCKQLGTALMMYAQDHDETLPSWPINTTNGVVLNPGFATWGWSLWVDVITPYVKNRGVFVCPNGPRTGYGTAAVPNAALAGPRTNPMVVNYAINEYIQAQFWQFSTLARLTSARNGPSDVTVIAESCFNGIYQDWSGGFNIPGRGKSFGLWRLYCANKAGNNLCEGRHKGHGINAVYADGHAGFTPGERIQGGQENKREYPIVNPNIEPWK